ncbi:hypothetical protein [Nocardia sp. alder85J]|uniref:hypothetical protein n=1 Tax=Nocardia sp. alder85J TaxID=2862949 RepID=UPI001CD1D7B9|nr:hypothetical protein [Nocardia sp. alder85J]MCX4093388.1 hypothetical protein [Nocardia sp. alder85J]
MNSTAEVGSFTSRAPAGRDTENGIGGAAPGPVEVGTLVRGFVALGATVAWVLVAMVSVAQTSPDAGPPAPAVAHVGSR